MPRHERLHPLEVKRIIESSAREFNRNLLNRHVLFGPTDGTKPFETYYPDDCFFHLCGLRYKSARQKVSAKKFFQLAVDGRIDADLFAEKYSVYTVEKLLILPSLMRIDTFAAKLSPFPLVRYGKTKAEILVFNNSAVLGYRFDYSIAKAYIPCTALKDQVPKMHDEKNIGFVLKSNSEDTKYSILSKPKKTLSPDQKRNCRKTMSHYTGSFPPLARGTAMFR
ncbi:MAG: PBECR4 domain-containing protein [Bifidobacterium crudilactis]|jgi:hypothetical protein